jgi:hypothetical protein
MILDDYNKTEKGEARQGSLYEHHRTGDAHQRRGPFPSSSRREGARKADSTADSQPFGLGARHRPAQRELLDVEMKCQALESRPASRRTPS